MSKWALCTKVPSVLPSFDSLRLRFEAIDALDVSMVGIEFQKWRKGLGRV